MRERNRVEQEIVNDNIQNLIQTETKYGVLTREDIDKAFSTLYHAPENLTNEMVNRIGAAFLEKNPEKTETKFKFLTFKPDQSEYQFAKILLECNENTAKERWKYLSNSFGVLKKAKTDLPGTIIRLFYFAFNSNYPVAEQSIFRQISTCSDLKTPDKFQAHFNELINYYLPQKTAPSPRQGKME